MEAEGSLGGNFLGRMALNPRRQQLSFQGHESSCPPMVSYITELLYLHQGN